MEDKKEPQQPIIDQLKEYVETRVKLAKYKVIDSSSSIVAGLITDIVIAFAALLAFLFASFTLALFLGDLFNSYWKGFGVVALFYLLIAIIVVVAKKSFEKSIINAFIKKILNSKKK
jgi:hypothetical protein